MKHYNDDNKPLIPDKIFVAVCICLILIGFIGGMMIEDFGLSFAFFFIVSGAGVLLLIATQDHDVL